MNSFEPWLAPVELPAAPLNLKDKESPRPLAPVELPSLPRPFHAAANPSQTSGLTFVQPQKGKLWGRRFQEKSLTWLVFGAVTWLVGVWLEETLGFLLRQFQLHWALGTVFAVLVLTTLIAAGVLLLNEGRGFVRLRRFDGVQAAIQRLWAKRTHGQGLHLALQLRREMTQEDEVQKAWREFYDLIQDHHDDREVLELLSRTVYATLDRRCYRMIVQHGSTTAIASTISPFVWLDSLVFLWQNLRMIRTIATCYGLKPGGSASLFLAREVMVGLFMAGTADLMADKVAEAVGGHTASIVLAQVGKGIANALFTARVGLAAMNRCRAVPFHSGGEPSMDRLRLELFKTIKISVGRTDSGGETTPP
ncbi:MAG: hypothetical protein HW380_631 [Magnetococcales bacterium]|nr:hypothetical protein [Magnetococcales bacterium]HIJ84253.1 DUF697 domain-containing protein [Magnetococcales bacterium]